MDYTSIFENGPGLSLTVRTISYEDDETAKRQSKAGGEQISTYVKAICFLLKSYATNSNVAKARSETAALQKTSMKTSVLFADVLRTLVARFEVAYPAKHTKELFIDGLPCSIKVAVKRF